VCANEISEQKLYKAICLVSKVSVAMKHFTALVRKAKFAFNTSRLKCDLKS